MLEWIMKNEGYFWGIIVVIVVFLFIILLISITGRQQRHFHQQMVTTLNQIREQQIQLERTVGEKTNALGKQVSTELLHTQQEMTALSKALRTPNKQGIWGELQLLNCLKAAEMEEYCDFEAQKTFPKLDQLQRPDYIISIPPDRCVAIDAKTPLQSYLTAHQRMVETGEKKHMDSYIKSVKRHITDLAQKEYWRQGNAPEFVIMFLPGEAMFRAAIEHNTSLLEYGLQHKIVLASPSTLLAMLKVIAYGWSVESRAQHVEQLLKYEQQVHRHLVEAHQKWNTLRTQLDEITKTFNQVMTSYAETLAPAIERMRQLDTTLKNASPAITPLHLLQRRLEPVPMVPQDFLLPERPNQEDTSTITHDA